MKTLVALTVSLALAGSAMTAAAQQSPSTPGAQQSPAPPGAGQNPATPGAQQSPATPSAPQDPAKPGIGQSAVTSDAAGHPATIDCPAEKAKDAPSAMPGPAGTPSGAATGSGIAARPSQGPPQKLEGVIEQVESTRTERGIMVGNVKLWVEPTTAILVDCQKAMTDDLTKGTRVKAIYEVKDGRNVAKVIEAGKK
jgi:hypothetical protein